MNPGQRRGRTERATLRGRSPGVSELVRARGAVPSHALLRLVASPDAVRRNTAICRTVWPGRSGTIEAECTSNMKVSPWMRQEWLSICATDVFSGRHVAVPRTGSAMDNRHSKGCSNRDCAELLSVFRFCDFAVFRIGTRCTRDQVSNPGIVSDLGSVFRNGAAERSQCDTLRARPMTRNRHDGLRR